MVVHATVRPNNALQEMRRLAKTKKQEKTGNEKKRPSLGAGRHGGKFGKEIPENELEQKIAENEFKRRQWLMNWHMEVVEMQNELYDLEQCLQKSIVRTQSAKARDRAAKKEAAAPQMTEEEIEKLPVRMRPRPKYEPYVSRRQRSEINLRSYEKIIQNLHDNPRKFDVITPDISGERSHFPDITMADAERFKLLLMRNPFNKHTEKEDLLMRIKMEPFLQMSGRGIAPKKMVVSSRSGEATTLPSLRASTMVELRDTATKPLSRAGDKSVRFDGSQEHLPSITGPNIAKSSTQTKPEVDKSHPSLHLPAVSEKKEEKTITKSTAAAKPRPATSIGSHSTRSGKTSPTSSTYSSLTDSDSISQSAGARRKTTKAKRLKDTKAAVELPEMSVKNEPNLLDNAEFRRSLIEELDKKRLERIENTKWGLVKNTFKASTLLKVQMPDVIRDAATSKHHNRAIDQVQERIKARAAAEAKETAMSSGFSSNLLRSKGMSKSMPLLVK